LVEALQHPRSLSYNPVFQVMLVIQTREPTSFPAALSAPVITTSKFDLSFNIVDTGDHLEVLISWSTDLFDASTIAHLGALWERLLSSVCAAPDRRLSELCFVSAEETRMLEDWSGESFRQPIK
jgi:non-ribosomal peptide synthetase component F